MSASDSPLEEAVDIARAAGVAVLEVYEAELAVRTKGDGSPVTAADERAEGIILERLARIAPHVPIVSEESQDAARSGRAAECFWLVDPLDGTREFLEHRDEFTINIALVEDGMPRVGVVLAPATGRLFAAAPGVGAFVEDAAGRRPIAARQTPEEGATVVASRSHGDAQSLRRFLAGRSVAASLPLGSSLKFCLVAAGEADLYPRLGRTMEWDTAAGDAVLRAAGGCVRDLEGDLLRYGKPGFENPHFVARGRE